jgi:hypothetical protein
MTSKGHVVDDRGDISDGETLDDFRKFPLPPVSQHSVIKNKLTGAIAVGALAAGTLATAGLGSAPTANATCASVFGIGNSAQCTSTLFNLAIAVGTNAEAHAGGMLPFGAAVAFGNGAVAEIDTGFSLAVTVGANSRATVSLGAGNIAANIFGNATDVAASGLGVVAVNLLGNASDVEAVGLGDVAVNLLGNSNTVYASILPGSVAFNAFGSGNDVEAGPGLLAIAASILQTNATITKAGPGFNINGLGGGGAAAVGNAKPATPTAATSRATNTTARSNAIAPTNEPTVPAVAASGPRKPTARAADAVDTSKPATASPARRAFSKSKPGKEAGHPPAAAHGTDSTKKTKA